MTILDCSPGYNNMRHHGPMDMNLRGIGRGYPATAGETLR